MGCLLVDKFFDAKETISINQKKSKLKENNVNLNNSEIRFLNLVYLNPNVNSVELGKIIGVGRSAISQWGNQLESKSLLEKYGKSHNKKEKFYKLTKKGKLIRQEYEKKNIYLNKSVCQYISQLTKEDKKTILNFLNIMANSATTRFECLNQCSCEKK